MNINYQICVEIKRTRNTDNHIFSIEYTNYSGLSLPNVVIDVYRLDVVDVMDDNCRPVTIMERTNEIDTTTFKNRLLQK